MTLLSGIKDLEKHLNSYFENAMAEVAEVVKKKESEKVNSEVYGRYKPSTPDGEPWVHKRRKEKGGLADTKNMKHTITQTANGVELSVTNKTKGKNDNFAITDLVENGDGFNSKEYRYKTNRDGTAYQYLRPRPFTKETVAELERTGEHIDAFKNGLKKQGLDIK